MNNLMTTKQVSDFCGVSVSTALTLEQRKQEDWPEIQTRVSRS